MDWKRNRELIDFSPLHDYLLEDEDGNIHVASLTKSGEQILYSCLRDGKFSDPEVVMELRQVIGVTGIDIAYVDNYVYVTASQGPYMNISRRKVR